MSRGNTWTNSDGLVVGFGTHSEDNDVPGVATTSGVYKQMVLEIVGVDVIETVTDATIPPQAAQIKRGSWINKATILVTEAFTGTGTIDIGTWGRGTLATPAVDVDDGIDANIDIDGAGVMGAIGDTVECDGALVSGAVAVGETSNSDCVISVHWTTAVPTAGRAQLVIDYMEPVYTSASLA